MKESKGPQRVTKIKPFIKKYNWKQRNFRLENDDWKKIERNNVTIALNKYILLMFQNIIQIVKNRLFF